MKSTLPVSMFLRLAFTTAFVLALPDACADSTNPPAAAFSPGIPKWSSRQQQRALAGGALKTNLPWGSSNRVELMGQRQVSLSEIGPHHRTWAVTYTNATSPQTNKWGAAPGQSRGSIVEIGTGMNYWDGQKWTPSDPSFDISPDGDAFVANKLHYKVRLQADDLNTIGSITVTTPDGHVLSSTPVAIGLYDALSGKSLVLAGVTNCPGILVSSNQVWYEDAFNENGVRASVVCTAERGSFAADVVLTAPLNPADYGFPAKTTRIQIFTEYYDAPEPERIREPIRVETNQAVRLRMASPDLMDETLGFGEYVLGKGEAYAASRGTNSTAACVAKEFKTVNQRKFLIESVEYSDIQKGLAAMLETGSKHASLKAERGARLGYAAIPKAAERSGTGVSPLKTRDRSEMASITPREISGVVIDPTATIGGTISGAKVFQGDTTYFVSAPTYCNGPVTIEGGAVFKYPNATGPNPTTAFIMLNSTLTCKTSSYRPAIFTAGDDDSIGESLGAIDQTTGQPFWPGYTGELTYLDQNQIPIPKYYANPAINGLTALTLSQCRFAYAKVAVRCNGYATIVITVNHAQFINCIQGFSIISTGSSGSGSGLQVTAYNCLLANLTSLLTVGAQSSGSGRLLYLNHCTTANATQLIGPGSVFVAVIAKNSIFANVSAWGAAGYFSVNGDHNGYYANGPTGNSTFGTSNPPIPAESPFLASGAGNYYLKSASAFRGAGTTTSIASTLLNALKTRTTQPPIAFPVGMEVTGELTLFPQVPRYVSGPPDLGYYYDVLDYSVAHMILGGGNVHVLPGTAIAMRNDFAPWLGQWTFFGWSLVGFHMEQNSTLVSLGTPSKPNVITAARFVQEGQVDFGWNVAFIADFEGDLTVDAPPNLSFRFCDFSFPHEDLHLWSGYGVPSWSGFDANSSVYWSLQDCTLRGGQIALLWTDNEYAIYPAGSVTWTNNTFDRVLVDLLPTWYPDNGTINVDLSFTACNNLFRGQLLNLDPIPASGGKWLFVDNLFDKSAFGFYAPLEQPDWAGPIDHDYNAYWQRLSSELEPWQTDRLTANNSDGGTDAVNDRILASVPAYQSGPLGDFYVATSSPLYDISKRGSRSVADAGLYHYTTRTDQLKDGSQAGNSIIGRHYVATVSSSSTTPKGTDSDGIPDFVENWHGDGDTGANRIHTTDETDWDNPTTDGTADQYSMIYDDIDLDGDGMCGRIEKALNPAGPQPLVPDNPLIISQITDGPQSCIKVFKLSVNHDSLANVAICRLSIDGGFGNQVQAATRDNIDGSMVLTWNGTFNYPMLHVVQPRLHLTTGFEASKHPIVSAAGPLVLANTENSIMFDPFYADFDSSAATLYATLAELEADYTIELRDPSAGDSLITTITGNTTSGEIQEEWYLTDDRTGGSYTGDAVKANFSVSFGSGIDASFSLFLTRLYVGSWADGAFTVAYSWDNPQLAGPGKPLHQCVQWGVVDLLIKPTSVGGVAPNPYSFAFNDFSWSGGAGNPGFISNPSLVNNLLADLSRPSGPVTRNFYWYGHGSISTIEGGANGVVIRASAVEEALGHEVNMTPDGFPSITYRHPYRFVFIDGCSTAQETIWSDAFGIPKEISARAARRNPEKARAYMGYDVIVASVTAGGSAPATDYQSSLYWFFWLWQNGYPLELCKAACTRNSPFDGSIQGLPGPPDVPSVFLNFPLGASTGVPLRAENGGNVKIYGYRFITRTGVQ